MQSSRISYGPPLKLRVRDQIQLEGKSIPMTSLNLEIEKNLAFCAYTGLTPILSGPLI